MKPMHLGALAAALSLGWTGAGQAQNYRVKDATGATLSMASKLNGGVNLPLHAITDATGANTLSVSGAGAAKVDGSGVTQPVSNAGSFAVQCTSGCSSTGNAAAGAIGSAVPSSGDYVAGDFGGLLKGWTLDASGYGAVNVENSVAVTGTFWQATQPVSAASLPLPAGAATAANQPSLGAAGAASADVLSVQGVASMTPLKVDGAGVTQPVSGTFWQTTQPVSLASLPALTAGSAVIGHVVNDASSAVIGHVIVDSAPTTTVTGTFFQTNQQVVGNVAAGSSDIGNGVKVSGVYNSTLPTLMTGLRGDLQLDSDSVLFSRIYFKGQGVWSAAGTNADALAPISVATVPYVNATARLYDGTNQDRAYSIQGVNGTGLGVTAVAEATHATNGTSGSATSTAAGSIVLKSSAGNLYSFDVVAGATAGYFMLFDATSAPADGTVTPKWCLPLAASQGFSAANTPIPMQFSTGITAVFSSTGCFTKTISATAFISGQVQ